MDNNQNQNNVPTNSNSTPETPGVPYSLPETQGMPDVIGKENLSASPKVQEELGDTAVKHSEGPADTLGVNAPEGDSATELNPTDPATEAEPKEEV